MKDHTMTKLIIQFRNKMDTSQEKACALALAVEHCLQDEDFKKQNGRFMVMMLRDFVHFQTAEATTL